MFEVKATTGDDMSFELGESEVRQAQRLTDGDDYRIIHITHVSDPDQTKLRVLPNPFGAGGFDHFRILGSLASTPIRTCADGQWNPPVDGVTSADPG